METRWRREGLGFLEERYENSSFLLEDADVSHGLGSRRVKEAVYQSWASLGLAHARSWSAEHGWVPVGPSFCWSAGGATRTSIIMGPPALLAYMALN